MPSLSRSIVPHAVLVFFWTVAASSGEAHVKFVTDFAEHLEQVMDGTAAERFRRLQLLYGRSFDIAHIAREIAPAEIWSAADTGQRQDISETVLCRLARSTAKRSPRDKPQGWTVTGTRTTSEGEIVAMRMELPDGRQQTIQFIVASVGGLRIKDVRSEKGRLTGRLAEEIERDTATLAGHSDIEAWLKKAACGR